MYRWNLKSALAKFGNANQFAVRVGVGYPTARRLWEHPDATIERLDMALLEAIAAAAGVDDPLTLLKRVPDKK